MKIDATRPAADYYPAIAQAFLGSQGLPMEITFAQLSAQLKAKGLDLERPDGGTGPGGQLLRIMQALQAITQQPVKLVYKQEGADVIYIEKKTGATVGATFDRTTSMQMDTTNLLQAFAIIGKYAQDPNVGPAIQKVMQAAGQLARRGPRRSSTRSMSIIKTSEATLAADAKEQGLSDGLVELWIPLIIVIVGAIGLVLGGFLLYKSRKVVAPAA